MSGVIIDGVQWEHCGHCWRWVTYCELGYEYKSTLHPYGRDLCVTCVDHLIRAYYIRFEDIVPARGWLTYEVA